MLDIIHSVKVKGNSNWYYIVEFSGIYHHTKSERRDRKGECISVYMYAHDCVYACHTTRNAGKLFPPVPPPKGGNLIRQLCRPALPLPDWFLGHALVLEFLMFHVLWSTLVC